MHVLANPFLEFKSKKSQIFLIKKLKNTKQREGDYELSN